MAFGWSLATAILILSTGEEFEAINYTAKLVSVAFFPLRRSKTNINGSITNGFALVIFFFDLLYEWIFLYLWGT